MITDEHRPRRPGEPGPARTALPRARASRRVTRDCGSLTLIVVNLVGLIAFLWPFLLPVAPGVNENHAGDGPVILAVLVLPRRGALRRARPRRPRPDRRAARRAGGRDGRAATARVRRRLQRDVHRGARRRGTRSVPASASCSGRSARSRAGSSSAGSRSVAAVPDGGRRWVGMGAGLLPTRGSPIGRRIDESSPMVDARLPDGSRVNSIIPPLSLRPDDHDPKVPQAPRAARRRSVCLGADEGVWRRSCRRASSAAQRPDLGRYRLREDDATERASSGFIRTAERIVTIEDRPSFSSASATWSGSRRARRTSRAKAPCRSATWCGTPAHAARPDHRR